MALLMSSPMGPPARFDILRPPSSPRFYSQHDDLPADFDKSFGSSMSISDSYDASQPVLGGPVHLFNSTFGLAHTLAPQTTKPSSSRSPRPTHTLGAAMGTSFASRSPDLGNRMSSPRDMDISPAPFASHHSPAQSLPRLMHNIHVGSSAKASRRDSARSSKAESSSKPLAANARLFGTELSLNSPRHSSKEQELMSSPDKEPPPKRRPSSLPTRQIELNDTATSLLDSLSARTRPALFSSLTGAHPLASSHLMDPVNPRQRLSGSHLPPKAKFQRSSPRAGSAQSFFDEASRVNSQLSQSTQLDDEDDDLVEGLDGVSPSPSMSGTMAAYFYNPMSPEKQAVTTKPIHSPNLLAAMVEVASSSPLGSSPCTRMPPPKRTTSLGVRTFERTHTSAAVPRQSSASSYSSTTRTTLGKRANPYVKRPTLSNDARSTKSAYPVLGVHGQTTRLVRPTAPAPRRCFSSIDHSATLAVESADKMNHVPSVAPLSPERHRAPVRGYSEVSDANGSPIAPGHRARPNFLRRISKDDSSPLAYGTGMKRSGSRNGDLIVDDLSINDGTVSSSPASAESMPGFGASEKEGKVLPCFNVKDDGLMRVSPQTVTDLLGGKYTNAIASFQLVDCRFEYEYQGGHIPGAVNLSTVEKVISHFLKPGQGQHAGGKHLPPRSQSGKADCFGNRKKHVLVFHCEFSAKRAPSMALALRQADRGLVHDYPNCHFPELYVLQGGYCDFFRTYANLCEPQQYVCMDDPRYHAKRSTELNGFRKQFLRHRSFTYGEGKRQQSLPCTSSTSLAAATTAGRNATTRCIQEEEDCPIVEDSPVSSSNNTTTGAATHLVVPQHHIGNHRSAAPAAPSAAVGDTSFGSVGDSSFEEGIGDSPCAAAAGTRKTVMLLPPRIGSLGGAVGGAPRRPLLRAGTTNDILRR